MNKHLIILALILMLTACGPTPIAVLSSPTASANGPSMIPASPAPQEVTSTPITQPPPTVISVPETSGTLWLQVISPQDEAVVNTPQVDVIGLAPAGAVVSVNDEILIVGEDQQFKITVSLDGGPNLIEIIASDDNGNETSLILAVTYEP
jgi:hypothetical protein